jgi:hypothetical protein
MDQGPGPLIVEEDRSSLRSAVRKTNRGSRLPTEWHPPPGGFYVQAFNGSVSLPLLDMPTRATGLVCWRDFHRLEWDPDHAGR